METIKSIIKKIIANPYIGFTLLLKDVIEILSNIIKFKTTLMDTSFYINIIVDLFIAVVIYNLLRQYKLKVDKNDFDTLIQTKVDKKDFDLLNDSLKINQANLKKVTYDHALQLCFFKALLRSNNIKESSLEDVNLELNDDERKYLGFDTHEDFYRVKQNIKDLKQPIQKIE